MKKYFPYCLKIVVMLSLLLQIIYLLKEATCKHSELLLNFSP